ncbi:MAG TPA: Clp protease N-terminal domain-containing protein [Acidimicrobiia bacterium]
MERLPDLEELVAWIDRPDRDSLELLTDAVILSGRLGELADDLVDHFVQRARRSGGSWADIGQAIGVSKQAAQKRFVRRAPGFRGPKRGLFTRFAPEARSVVKRAVEYAHDLGSPEIGTLHLVAALTDVESGARAILEGVGGDVEAIQRTALGSLRRPPDEAPTSSHIPFAADSKKVLELSLREAIHGEGRHIGTEHIVLGILRDEGSAGARLLNEHGVSRDAVRRWLDENPSSAD